MQQARRSPPFSLVTHLGGTDGIAAHALPVNSSLRRGDGGHGGWTFAHSEPFDDNGRQSAGISTSPALSLPPPLPQSRRSTPRQPSRSHERFRTHASPRGSARGANARLPSAAAF